MSQKEFCFGTLALGKKYRSLAVELAKDLEKFSSANLIVLTDRPQDFKHYPNVLAFKHQQQSVECYHDKRCVIEKALSLYDTCVFVDADMRILAEVPHIEWQSGISARSCSNILKHNRSLEGPNSQKNLALIEDMACEFNLDLSKVKFISEFLFAVTKDSGKEIKFLNLWETISKYFELNGIYGGEGSVIGLAAAAARLSIEHDEMPGIDFFNDKIERVRIKMGQVDPNARLEYFEQLRQKTLPDESPLKKLLNKFNKITRRFYYIIRLRIVTLADFNFYYHKYLRCLPNKTKQILIKENS